MYPLQYTRLYKSHPWYASRSCRVGNDAMTAFFFISMTACSQKGTRIDFCSNIHVSIKWCMRSQHTSEISTTELLYIWFIVGVSIDCLCINQPLHDNENRWQHHQYLLSLNQSLCSSQKGRAIAHDEHIHNLLKVYVQSTMHCQIWRDAFLDVWYMRIKDPAFPSSLYYYY